MSRVAIGLDPSSKKIAVAVSVDGRAAEMRTVALSLNNIPKACYESFMWVRKLCLEFSNGGNDVYLFIEEPVVGRGGVRSTLQQTKTHGAMLAGAQSTGVEVHPVVNSRWKKVVVGKGNAGKPEIKAAMRDRWPKMYLKAGGDQDLLDAGAILIYGQGVLDMKDRITYSQEPVKRLVKPRPRKATTRS